MKIRETKKITVWECDGTVNLTDIGWTDNTFKRFFFVPGQAAIAGPLDGTVRGSTFQEENGADNSGRWFNVDTRDFDWMEVQGNFRVVDIGTLTSIGQEHEVRLVALRSGMIIKDPELYPNPVHHDPLHATHGYNTEPTNASEKVHSRMWNVLLGGVNNKTSAGAGGSTAQAIENKPIFGGGGTVSAAPKGGLFDQNNLADDVVRSWGISPTEICCYDATGANSALVRSPIPGIRHTDQVFFAICINAGSPAGLHTTTKVKGELNVILHRG